MQPGGARQQGVAVEAEHGGPRALPDQHARLHRQVLPAHLDARPRQARPATPKRESPSSQAGVGTAAPCSAARLSHQALPERLRACIHARPALHPCADNHAQVG